MKNQPIAMTTVELRALAKEVKNRDLRFADTGFELTLIECDAIARGLLLLAVLMDNRLDA